MKLILFIGLLASTSLSIAKVTPPVNHSHGERTHSHSLPVEGLAHRHGSGEPGQAIQNRQGANTKKKTSTSYVPENKRYQGFTQCLKGDADCNVCATDVQNQFQRAESNQINWRSKPWRFTWPQRYPPNNLRPLDIFDGDPAYALGIPDKHVQGFVHTNSDRFPFAGSHSHKEQGGIFVITQQSDGKKFLSTLHRTKTKHPSGVHVLGKYLLYGEGNSLIFKDLESPQHKKNIELPVPGANVNFGGGIGVVKLSTNRHLVITSGPGGQKNLPRFHRFYLLESRQGQPFRLSFLNESSASVPSEWPKGYAFSENLTVITECGTGDIYTVHTSGEEKGVQAVKGRGFWRLSKLELDQNNLGLKAIRGFSNHQNLFNCSMRAAATVYVSPQHQLEFYCHAYAKDPDGSILNVLGQSSRGADKFYFRSGVLR